MTVEDQVRHVVSTILGVSIAPGADLRRPDEPKWDSLKHVELILAVEEEFDVQFDTEQMAELASLSDIVKAVKLADAS